MDFSSAKDKATFFNCPSIGNYWQGHRDGYEKGKAEGHKEGYLKGCEAHIEDAQLTVEEANKPQPLSIEEKMSVVCDLSKILERLSSAEKWHVLQMLVATESNFFHGRYTLRYEKDK